MRTPNVVFSNILKLIPNYYLNAETRNIFEWFISDAIYKAPEQYPEVFKTFSIYLSKIIPHSLIEDKRTRQNWMIEVYSEFSTIPVQEILDELKKKDF